MSDERVQRRLAAILAADVVGYSRLMGENEASTYEALKTHRRELIDPRIAANNGRIVKLMGDGVLVEFASVVDAVRCAVDIQREMPSRNADVPNDRRIQFRIGINLGDVIIDGEDIYGDGVNVAARLEGLADPGAVFISRTVFDHVTGKVELGFEDLGEHKVKNIADPVHVYRVLTGAGDSGKLIGPAQPHSTRWKRPAIAAGFAFLVAFSAAAIWLRPWAPAVELASVAEMAYPLPDKPSIAVLPFVNMSDDPNQEYFAQGMTDDLITDLSKVSGLFVISRNSTFAYKDRAVKIRQVAEELGVRFVLEGSVRRVGDEVRINVQLIDALTGGHVWAERYDRNLRDIFALQDEVVDKVVSALSVELESGEQDRLHRTYALTAESYDLFLHARTMLPTYMTDRGHLLRARQLFERIVEQAGGFSGGYAGLSQTYSLAVMRGYSSTPIEEANEALKLAQKAWDIDADFEMAGVAMANAQKITGQSEDAIATLEKMLKSAPSNADAHAQRGRLLIWAGRAKEAIDPINTAVRLNPDFGSPYLIDLGLANFSSGDYEAAIAAFEKNHARGGPIDDAGLAVWTASNNELGRSNEAAEILDRLFDSHPDFHLRSFWLMRLYERPEDRTRLNDIFQRANIPMDRPYTR